MFSYNAGFRVTRSHTLPTFSSRVKQALEDGKADRVWSPMIIEAASYYLHHWPNINSHAEYKIIGEKFVDKYPCLSKDGPHPWVRKKLAVELQSNKGAW